MKNVIKNLGSWISFFSYDCDFLRLRDKIKEAHQKSNYSIYDLNFKILCSQFLLLIV